MAFRGSLPPELEKTVVDEAARVWAPYGVMLDVAPAPPGALTLLVSVEDRPGRGVNAHALGSIEFHDAVPDPVISLYASTAAEFLTEAATAETKHWPAAYRDRILARVLGRALAHELGHYLLRTRDHSARGLMRANQSIVDLMNAYDKRLLLSADQETALNRVLAGR